MRESCIQHRHGSAFVQIRSDYQDLVDGDTVAAAILSIFEYWANGMIAVNPALADKSEIWLGKKSAADFEARIVQIAGHRQIRERLKHLEEAGFIRSKGGHDGYAKSYCFIVQAVQTAIEEGVLQKTSGGVLQKTSGGVLQKTSGGVLQKTSGGSYKKCNSSISKNLKELQIEDPEEAELTPSEPDRTRPIATLLGQETIRQANPTPVKPELEHAAINAISPAKTGLEDAQAEPAYTSKPGSLAEANKHASESKPEVSNTSVTFSQENLEAPFWAVQKAPWHTGPMSYSPIMIRAVSEILPRCDGFRLMNGDRNDVAISKHLRNLEANAQNNFGFAALKARQDLLDYWKHAQDLEEREVPKDSKGKAGWLEEMRIKGQRFYRAADGRIDQERILFFHEHSYIFEEIGA
jgi:hypothetical protein